MTRIDNGQGGWGGKLSHSLSLTHTHTHTHTYRAHTHTHTYRERERDTDRDDRLGDTCTHLIPSLSVHLLSVCLSVSGSLSLSLSTSVCYVLCLSLSRSDPPHKDKERERERENIIKALFFKTFSNNILSFTSSTERDDAITHGSTRRSHRRGNQPSGSRM